MTVFMITHKQRFQLQEVRNIYYYETITGNPSASEWQDICDEIRADYVSYLQSGFVPEWEFYGIDYREVSSAGLPSFSVVPTAGVCAGTSGNDSTATQVALLVSVKENVTKPNHARTYLCGVNETGMTDSLWLSGIRGLAEDFIDYQSVLNSLGTNELQRVTVTWNSGHTMVVAYNNIAGAAAVASEVPATQRRRRIGVGI